MPDTRERLNQGQLDYPVQLTRALGTQGRSEAAFDPLVGLGVQLDDWTRPEFWVLRNGTRWQCLHTQAGVVGQRGYFQASGMPGVLAVLEEVTITNRFGGPLDFNYGIGIQDTTGAPAAVSPMDDRQQFGVGVKAIGVGGQTLAAPVLPATGYIVVPNDTTVRIPLDVILTGATAGITIGCWKLVCLVVNAGFSVTLTWRERTILPSEL